MELKIKVPNKMFSAMRMHRFFIIVLLLTVLLPPSTFFAQDDSAWVLPEGATGHFGKGEIVDFTFSPDGRWLATCTTSEISIYNTDTGKENTSFNTAVDELMFSLDGSLIVGQGAKYNEGVEVWDVMIGRHLFAVQDGVMVGFLPHRDAVAIVDIRERLGFWDVRTGDKLMTFTGTKWKMPVFSHDKSLLANVINAKIEVRDASTGQLISSTREDTAPVKGLLFSRDGKTFMSGHSDGMIYQWVTAGGNWLATFTEDATDRKRPPGLSNAAKREFRGFRPDEEYIDTIALSSSGKTLASASHIDHHRIIRLWHLETGRVLLTLTNLTTSVFSPDGSMLATTNDSETIQLWDMNTGTSLSTFSVKGGISRLVFSPDRKTLAVEGQDASLRLWDIPTRDLHTTITGYMNSVGALAYSPDGTMLASGHWGGEIRVWNTITGTYLSILTENKNDALKALAFSQNGKILASSGWPDIVQLWDVNTGRQLSATEADLSTFKKLFPSRDFIEALSQDGSTLARMWGDMGTRISLIDVATGHQFLLTDQAESVSALTFSPDGRTLASGSGFGTILFWDLTAERASEP